MQLLVNLLKDEDGQGMVEYGIIVALIAVVAIVAVKTLGTSTKKSYEQSSQMMDIIPQN